MPTLLSVEDHLRGLAQAVELLRSAGSAAGLDARVETVPDWTVGDVIAHLGGVHRWATGIIEGAPRVDTAAAAATGRAGGDLVRWLGAGAQALESALRAAPDDLDVWFFLNDAPAPRAAWARRQCHESTIHAVDAVSGSTHTVPAAAEIGLDPGLAADGVDELVCGMATQEAATLRVDRPFQVELRASDTGDVWRLGLSSGPVTAVRGVQPLDADEPAPDEPEADMSLEAVVTGTAAQLYLGLWNRGTELHCEGRDVLALWRDQMRVTWVDDDLPDDPGGRLVP